MRIALVQPPYPSDSTAEASRACIEWIVSMLDSAAVKGADLVLLPEYATAPGVASADDLRMVARGPGADLLEACRGLTQRRDMTLALGAVCERCDGVFNQAVLIHSGSVVHRADKSHLTDVERNVLKLTAGGTSTIAELDDVRLAFAICFDVYFPEFMAALAVEQPDVILSPSYQRSESAERLLIFSASRALDCGAWFLRAAYAMDTPGRGGHSLVASPSGEIVADAGEEAGVCTVEIDPKERFVKPSSHGQPPLEHRSVIESHRRPQLYRPAVDRRLALATAPFPRLCAHRGLSLACPENTLPAFAAAIGVPGVAEIELDLWLSGDGVPVVCHDPTVDRTTDGHGRITEMGWEDIRALNAHGGLGDIWSGVGVPRFEQILDLAEGRVGLNIHIKDPGPDGQLVRLVADLLRERGLDRVGYIAGDVDVLAVALDYAPTVRRCCLASQRKPADMIAKAVQYHCSRVQFSRSVTAEAAAEAAGHDLIRNLFWSDDPAEARRYADLGIDVILTNCAHSLAGNLR